ncbi:hypothetical protein OK17_11445 [Gordonia sp. GN26]
MVEREDSPDRFDYTPRGIRSGLVMQESNHSRSVAVDGLGGSDTRGEVRSSMLRRAPSLSRRKSANADCLNAV